MSDTLEVPERIVIAGRHYRLRARAGHGTEHVAVASAEEGREEVALGAVVFTGRAFELRHIHIGEGRTYADVERDRDTLELVAQALVALRDNHGKRTEVTIDGTAYRLVHSVATDETGEIRRDVAAVYDAALDALVGVVSRTRDDGIVSATPKDGTDATKELLTSLALYLRA